MEITKYWLKYKFFYHAAFIEYELGLFSVFSEYTNFAFKKKQIRKTNCVKMRTNSATTRF